MEVPIESDAPPSAIATSATAERPGIRIEAERLTRTIKRGATVLQDVSFSIDPGQLVAVVGGSGAGKTTLLEAVAGVRPADGGRVLFDGVDAYRNRDVFRAVLGYVPQDDIIHLELPLERTLRYAAALRLPPSAGARVITAAVEKTMRSLDLTERRGVRVGALSGGQRKRASIAVELLTEPRVFFLDEPTSGLDPATDAELLRVLRRLADDGATVVFTTHSVQDLGACDRILFLARGGRLVFDGTLPEALAFFGVTTPEAVYEALASDQEAQAWAETFGARERPGSTRADDPARKGDAVPRTRVEGSPTPGPGRQWWVLTRRTFETLARNRLTLAILLGSPVLVVTMFAILFRPGAFTFRHPSPSAILMIVFWVTFGAFFFGLTYGLLQIVTERSILRRESLVGLRLPSYLLSKLAVLLPFLVFVDVLMLVVLRAMNRLPAVGLKTFMSIGVTLGLDAVAALALGLLTSAAVANPAQATLALPMICFPAVLFSGAILPVHLMAPVGAAISAVVPVRWAFEALGHDLGVRAILTHGGSALGPPLVQSYGNAGNHATGTYWAYLAVFTLVFLVGAWLVLATTSRRNMR
jgi:ABC-type multidrug transport system ATPase subunit